MKPKLTFKVSPIIIIIIAKSYIYFVPVSVLKVTHKLTQRYNLYAHLTDEVIEAQGDK